MARAIVARILPMTDPWAEAEAIVWDDVILHVGSQETAAAIAADRGIELEHMPGATVIPGFVDAHTHFLHLGVKRTRPDLRGARSKHEALQRVRRWLDAHDEEHCTGEGWDESEWDDGIPTRAELDDLSDRPLVLRRICGHMAVANTPALERIRAHWDDDRVDHETGLLLEEPSLYLNEVLPATPAVLQRAVDQACRIAHHLGVTSVGDYEQAPFRDALLLAARDGRLRIRLSCSIYVQYLEEAIAQGFRTGRCVAAAHDEEAAWELASTELEGAGPTADARLAIATGQRLAPPDLQRPESLLADGGLKVFLDGSLGGHTARMLEPYADRDTRGRANFGDDELDRLFRRAHDAGIQIHAHAIGDGAVEQGLQAFERLAEALRREGPRATAWGGVPAAPVAGHRFEHFEIVHDDQARRAAALGLWISAQPNFVGEWSAHGGMYEQRIGERFALNNRFRTWKDLGLRVAFGSDGMPFGPLYGIQSAVDHPVAAERLDPREAVWHYTHEAAASLGQDDIGSLQPGHQADVLVVENFAASPREWVIAETVLAGQTVNRNAEPRVSDDDVVHE